MTTTLYFYCLMDMDRFPGKHWLYWQLSDSRFHIPLIVKTRWLGWNRRGENDSNIKLC